MKEILEILPVGPFQCNCIILGDPVTKEAIVIDPGDQIPRILKKIEDYGLRVQHIVHTHSHIDHIGGTTELQKKTNARVAMHREDIPLYEQIDMQAKFLRLPPSTISKPVPVDEFLVDGYGFKAGNIEGQTIHTPGHTPGSCAFYFPKVGQTGTLFPGDTLFAGSIGRTDLWKGDYDQEITSIKKKLLPLGDEVIVIPGHGPKTTIGFEKKNNPFLALLLLAVFLIPLVAMAESPSVFYPKEALSHPPTSWKGEIEIVNLGKTAHTSTHLVWVNKGEKLHFHAKHDATVMLVRGKGVLRLGIQKIQLTQNSVVSIPQGVVHAFTNTSDKPSAAYVVFSPPFDPKDIIEIGELVK